MKNNTYYFVILALLLILSACNTMPKPKEDGSKDLIDKFATLKYATHLGLIDPDEVGLLAKLTNNPGKTTIDGVNEYRRWWCSNHSKNEMYNFVKQISFKHCNEMHGKWDGQWCRSESDTPLFFVDNGNLSHFKDPFDNHLPRCTSGTTFGVVASTIEGSNADAWQSRALNTYRFKTQQAQVKQKIEMEAQRLEEQQKKQAENERNAKQIEARGIGSRVCKKTNYYTTYTGFVEQIDQDRMRVRVTEKLVSRYHDNSFRQTTMWDKTSNWTACDSND